jgi:D-alanyl-D-alanine-carboxypeptidase/D-alanyl-D-alanine-endopeptidase
MAHPIDHVCAAVTLLLPLAAAAVLAAPAGPGIQDMPEVAAALAAVDAYLAEQLEAHDLPGLSAAVVYDGSLVWSNGYGFADLENQVPATARTLYDIGSVTKLFTATMLMQLRDAGAVGLDDPIEKHLPEFRLESPFPDARPLTFRQVAAHLAGLPNQPPGFTLEAAPSLEQMLASLSEVELAAPAWQEHKYSNFGYCIIGHALARASAQPFRQYVAEHVLAPLGMDDTTWEPTEAMRARLAVGYTAAAEDGTRGRPPSFDVGDGSAPAGGLYSTVEDLARFAAVQFHDGPAGGQYLLGGTTLREMRAPVTVWSDWSGGVGIGWFLGRVAGHNVAGHGGGTPGYSCEVQIVPDLELAFVVAANQVADKSAIARGAIQRLAPAFAATRARLAEQERPPLPPDADQLTGTYALPEDPSITYRVRIIDGRLQVAVIFGGNQVDAYELVPRAGGGFRVSGGPVDGESASFERDPETGTALMHAGAYALTRIEETEENARE